MKVIIAGGRNFTNQYEVDKAIALAGFNIDEVVCGCASGVDYLGEEFARRRQLRLTKFKPDWGRYHRAAGPKRNQKMAKYADALILIWNGESPGSKNMLQEARKHGLKVFEYFVDY